MAARRMVSARHLVGRTIVSLESNPFEARPDAPHSEVAHNPRIVLDDGSVLTFDVEETEAGCYGVCILRSPAVKRTRTRPPRKAQ